MGLGLLVGVGKMVRDLCRTGRQQDRYPEPWERGMDGYS